MLAAQATTGAVALALNNFENSGNYLHYLPRSNKLKVYKRPNVNQYTKNTNISARGNAILFGVNQFLISRKYFNGTIDYNQFQDQTLTNILGSMSPQFGLLFITYDVLNYLDGKYKEFMDSPNVKDFFYRMDNEYDEWINQYEKEYGW